MDSQKIKQDDKIHIGANIREVRQSRKMGQTEACCRAGAADGCGHDAGNAGEDGRGTRISGEPAEGIRTCCKPHNDGPKRPLLLFYTPRRFSPLFSSLSPAFLFSLLLSASSPEKKRERSISIPLSRLPYLSIPSPSFLFTRLRALSTLFMGQGTASAIWR